MPNDTYEPTDAGEDLRSRMAFIRGELRSDAGELSDTANRLFDWTAHVREHPWTSLGITAALAYFLVPKRVEINSPSAEELERLAANNKLVVESNPTPRAKSSFLSGLTSLVSHTVLRGAMGLIGHQLGQLLQPAEPTSGPTERQRPTAEPGPPPPSPTMRPQPEPATSGRT